MLKYQTQEYPHSRHAQRLLHRPRQQTPLYSLALYAHPSGCCIPAGEVEIRTIEIHRETDQFVILASDGLWDVMSSEEAVQYVHSVMGGTLGADSKGREEEQASNKARSGAGSGESSVSSRLAAVLRIV